MRMPARGARRVHLAWLVLGAGIVCPQLAAAQQVMAAPPSGGDAAFVGRYCVSCHNDKTKTAGLSLQGLGLDRIPERGDVWEKVLRKVRSGEMPPPNVRTRPDPAHAAALADHVEATLDRAAAATPNPGRPVIHRLNRAEYSNAVRDLLAVDVNPGAWLPVDDSGYGFDNIGAVLSTSPVLLERYMLAARRVSRMAVGDPSQKPHEEIYEAPRDPFKGVRNERLSDDLPFGSRAGLSVRHYFPVDGEYVFRVRFRGILPVIDGDDPFEFRMPVKAGLRSVAVTSPRENARSESEGPGSRAAAAPAIPYPVDLRIDGARVKRFDVSGGTPEISQLRVGGPYAVTGRGDTPSRARIFTCRPARASEERACARAILKTLVRRAFRRPATDADVNALVEVYERGRTATSEAPADFERGIQHAIEALLVSPEFLFRLERDREKGVFRVSDLELASRLSFFLWSSIPDDQLLDLAERGKLKDPAVLEAEVRRMLADARADAIVSNFAGQWLHLRNVETVQPDPVIFSFDEALRKSFIKETELLFSSILREDRSLLDLLRADYTYLNERLAEHYGVPNIYGPQFRRVAVNDPNRRGLLGQGSVLTLTSYPNRTSVVQRGKWILENLLGTPPPPPPADVPELEARREGKVLSLREQMDQHRANPVCASCHARMDPIGFALENYDGIGKWRTEDAGTTIDATGKLPDGTAFSGGAGLTDLLLTKYRYDFVRTAAEKLLVYALGRGVEYSDQPVIRAIAREAGHDDYRFSAFVLAIVKSTPFQMRKS